MKMNNAFTFILFSLLIWTACAEDPKNNTEKEAHTRHTSTTLSVSSSKDTVNVQKVKPLIPEFPGGTAKLQEYVNQKINKSLGSSKVIVQFRLDEAGKVYEATCTACIPENEAIKKDAIAVIKSMPPWNLSDNEKMNQMERVQILQY